MKKARELSLAFLQIIDFQYGLTDNPVSILPRSRNGVVGVKAFIISYLYLCSKTWDSHRDSLRLGEMP